MFCGPYYPEELSWRKKKEGSVDLTICLGSPSSVFVSSLGPSVWFGFSGLSFEVQFFKKQMPRQLISCSASLTGGFIKR